MQAAIVEMLSSKKFLAAIVAMIAAAVGRWGFQVDQEALLTVLSPLFAYILAQGIADHGSTAAKISAASPPPPSSTTAAVVMPLPAPPA